MGPRRRVMTGFTADPGTNFTYGQEPKIVTALTALAAKLKTTVYGISGYRTPAQSVAVGGFADDPHTKGEAADIGIGSSLRSSAGQASNAALASVGLWRPFDLTGNDPAELNHVQLLPSLGGPTESETPPALSGTATTALTAAAAAPSTSTGSTAVASKKGSYGGFGGWLEQMALTVSFVIGGAVLTGIGARKLLEEAKS